MKRLRTVLFWSHLAAGVAACLVIVIMSATGVALTYEKQMLAWFDGADAVVPPSSDAVRLPVSDLLARARAARPDATPTTLTLKSSPSGAAMVSFGRDGVLYLNPYTGEVLGQGSSAARRFFRAMTDWHRWLGMEGAGRATGRAITGAANLAFLFLVVSGFYLWWPRTWTWTQFRQVLWFRRGLSPKARDFNWHNVIGLWSAVPLAIVVATAVVISYPWASDLVFHAAGEMPPAARGAGPGAAAPRAPRGEASRAATPAWPGEAELAGVETAWNRAEQQVRDWRTIALRLPGANERTFAFTVDAGTGGQPQKRGQLAIDRASGEVVEWQPFSSQSRGRRWRTLLRFAHTGEVFGLTGQTIAGVVSAGSLVLAWTGIALTWRRFFGSRRRTVPQVEERGVRERRIA